MRLAVFVLTSAPLWAQTLQVPPPVTARGSAGSLLIKLTSPRGAEPLALQWEIAVPSEVIIDPRNVVAGSAAEAAEKSITCAIPQKQDRTATKFGCILNGGNKTIGDGTIAVLRYNIRQGASPGTVTVRVENALGVTRELKKVTIESAAGTITIR